jgi:hypothetical protein
MAMTASEDHPAHARQGVSDVAIGVIGIT